MPREHGEEFSFTNMTLFSLKTNLGFNHSGRWKETVIKIKGTEYQSAHHCQILQAI